MKVLENVEAIGIYNDEIRFISKKLDPVSVERSKIKKTVISDIAGVEDEIVGRERRTVIKLKDGVHCTVSDDKVKCGLFIS